MELHAVHYDKKYASLADALLYNRGVRVISILYMVSSYMLFLTINGFFSGSAGS